MQQIFLALQVLVAFGLIGIVLLQHGKGADAGAAFGGGGGGGGGGAGSLFGARGPATLLTRVTAVLALIFFVNSMALAYMAKQESEETRSVMEQYQSDAPADAPVPGADSAPDADSPRIPVAPGAGSTDTSVPAAPGTEDSAAAEVPSAPAADGDTETNTN